MNVVIRELTKAELKEALIREGAGKELPSMHDNWNFNFASQLKKLSHAKAYVLVTEENPQVIEGCMIFQWKEKVMPYISYLETAPYNRGPEKKHDDVAGCLIAFACRLSLASKDENHQGYLTFDVMEQNPKDEQKLIQIYSEKYGARRIGGTTTMIITPDEGERLMIKYLP
jgi:hypothetical protein